MSFWVIGLFSHVNVKDTFMLIILSCFGLSCFFGIQKHLLTFENTYYINVFECLMCFALCVFHMMLNVFVLFVLFFAHKVICFFGLVMFDYACLMFLSYNVFLCSECFLIIVLERLWLFDDDLLCFRLCRFRYLCCLQISVLNHFECLCLCLAM